MQAKYAICAGFGLLLIACGSEGVDSRPLSTAPTDLAPEDMPGEFVLEPSTVIALDVASGEKHWEARPPILNARPVQEDGGQLILNGTVSPSRCSFISASTKLDVASGALISAETINGPMTLEQGMPPINDGGLSIRYVLDPAAAQLATGLEAIDVTTGSTVWSLVEPGYNGRALVNPAAFGSGVIAATVGGRNPENQAPATAIDFIDEATGDILWTESGDPAVAIGGGIAYLLNPGSLEAHDVRTGTLRWRHEGDAAQVSANDHLVVVSGPAQTVAYDNAGNQVWDVPFGVDVPAIVRGGLLVGRDLVFAVTSSGLYAEQCPGGG